MDLKYALIINYSIYNNDESLIALKLESIKLSI